MNRPNLFNTIFKNKYKTREFYLKWFNENGYKIQVTGAFFTEDSINWFYNKGWEFVCSTDMNGTYFKKIE